MQFDRRRFLIPIAGIILVLGIVAAVVIAVVVPQQQAQAELGAAVARLDAAVAARDAAAGDVAEVRESIVAEGETASGILAVIGRGAVADPATLDALAAVSAEPVDDVPLPEDTPLPEALEGRDPETVEEADALTAEVDAETAALEERAAELISSRDALAAASRAVVDSVAAWGAATPTPPHAPAEPAAAYTAALAALADPADDADLLALVTEFRTAWTTALDAHEVASRSLPADQVQLTIINNTIIANKTYRLPSTFGDGLTPETQAAFAAMQAEAAAGGLDLYISSGFRSFGSQSSIYGNYAATQGAAEADRHSARPGHSEHQTGLTFDLNSITESFGATPEGIWVRDNAHRFGFVVRYPPEKEHITGYIWEPWHLRYLGVPLATDVHATGLTLEEYLGITSVYSY